MGNGTRSRLKNAYLLLLWVIVGSLIVVVPPHLFGIERTYGTGLFGIARTAVENIGTGSWCVMVPSLLLLGGVIGYLHADYWVLFSAAPVIFLPVLTTVEIFVDPTSHNLLPFELLVDLGLYGFPFFGALFGSVLKAKRTRAAKP